MINRAKSKRMSSVSGVVEFCHGCILVAQLWGVDIFECPEPLMSTHAPEKDSSNDPTPIAARLLATMSRSVHSWRLAVSFHPYCTGSSHLDCEPESAEPCQISILIRTRYPDAPRTASIPGNQIIHHLLLTLSPELLSYARHFPAPKGPIAHIGAEAHENGYVRITEVQTRVLNGPHSSRKIIMSSTSGRGFWLENVQMRHDSPSVENIVLFSTSSVDGGVSLPDGEEEVPQLPTNAGSTLHPLVDIGGVDTSTVSLKWQHFKPFDLLPKHRSRGEELPTAQQPQGTVRYVDKLPLRGVSMCSFDDSSGRIAMKMVGGKVRVVDFGAVSSQEHA
ncbi:hypothetical protein DL93DRAFT_816281 [Clavulina sp. PMI_390]|nr:hypothetical protein DL93DRAFT_816281 [Clavulina sp. PMI_390]